MTSRPDNGLAKTLAAMERVKIAAKEAAMQRLIRGAHDVVAVQRQLVPVDEGDLRDSITVTLPGQSTPPHSQPGGSRVAGENEVLVTAGNTDVRYPHHVEHGTVKMEASPYFFPGYRLNADKIKRAVASTFSRTARKEWNK
jgi:HK97 gp10 family phage protein